MLFRSTHRPRLDCLPERPAQGPPYGRRLELVPGLVRGGLSGVLADGARAAADACRPACRSEEHTSELQSLMRISYAVFCLKKKPSTSETHSNTLKPLLSQTHELASYPN